MTFSFCSRLLANGAAVCCALFFQSLQGQNVVVDPGTGNVAIGTPTPRAVNATGGWMDLHAGLLIGNYSNIGSVSFASTTAWPANGGLIAWNKAAGNGEIDMLNLSGGGVNGGFAFDDRDTQ